FAARSAYTCLEPSGVCRVLRALPTRRSSDLRREADVRGGRDQPADRNGLAHRVVREQGRGGPPGPLAAAQFPNRPPLQRARPRRSGEHTSELQSLTNIACPLLLAKNTPYYPA